jgi:non-ribosomal peptide synthase protein (TIGR01720 family)
MWPVLLEPGEPAGLGEPADALAQVRRQLGSVPDNGIGYGLLRYGSRDRDASRFLAALPPAEVSFNYMGQFSAGADSGEWHCGPLRDSRQARSHLIEIDGHVAAGRLEMTWTYSRNHHLRATIERVAGDFRDHLKGITAAAAHRKLTPGDFPLANLNQKGLDALIRRMSRAAASNGS